MFERILGWLRSGDPVVEQYAPGGPVSRAEAWREREEQIAAIDAKAREALLYGDRELMDRFIDERLELRAPRPRVRPPVPGRSS